MFDAVTYKNSGSRYFSSRYDSAIVEANVRKAFARRRSFRTREEVIPEEASLLNIANFTPKVYTEKPDVFFPAQEQVEIIVLADQGNMKMPDKVKETIKLLEDLGNAAMAGDLKKQYAPPEFKDRSFHYLPYHTDSSFEQTFLHEAALPQLQSSRTWFAFSFQNVVSRLHSNRVCKPCLSLYSNLRNLFYLIS